MIYLISHSNQYLKIGYSKNINKRICQLQVSSPVKLELLHLIDGDVSLEKELHLLFKDFRTNGEWFYYSDEILNYFKDKKCLLWREGYSPYKKREVSGIIKQERLNKKMSLASLGELYGCTAQSIKEIETREINGTITINLMHKIAKLFNKKFEYRFVNINKD